jgi:CRISPR-associated DxTHG motif protein
MATIKYFLIKTISENKKSEDEAQYILSEKVSKSYKIKESKYINMFDLIASNFDEKIVAIGTQKAIDIQRKVLNYKGIENSNIEYVEIEDEKKYDKILELLNTQISLYDSIVFDVSHGFRHLPILSTISLIMQSIQDAEKIEEIIYAKEIKPSAKYEIISLKEYLELAKLSYVLSSFESNYTIGNNLIFENENYQDLVDNLRIISTHILANSIKQIVGKDNSISKTIEILQDLLEEDKNISTFKKSINNIIVHLTNIQKLDNVPEYLQLFKLSSMMNERGYLLNSITLLNESIGFYCVDLLKTVDSTLLEHIEKFKKEDGNLYELAHQSKNVLKLQEKFAFPYLSQDQKLSSGQKTSLQKKKKKLKERLDPKILEEIKKSGFDISLTKIEGPKKRPFKEMILDFLEKNDFTVLVHVIYETEKLRNNLAHANSSNKIANVKSDLSKTIRSFKIFLE